MSDAFERYKLRLKESGYQVDETHRDRVIVNCPLGQPHFLVFIRTETGDATLAGDCSTRHAATALEELRLVGSRETLELLNHAEQRRRAQLAAETDQQVTRMRARQAAAEIFAAEQSAGEPDSWSPVDLGPTLRGETQPCAPSVGIRRTDNLRLVYAGREHAVIGEMESGKSWFLIASAASELDAGNHVVYVHYEDPDESDSVGRLIALGVPPAVIAKLLRFVAPTRPVTAEALARLLDPPPSLVIHDGVNEAMSMHRWGIREEDGAAQFRRHLVMPCLRVGAAVISGDHVVKNADVRGRYALGSIHKGNGISGALILLENAEPFGRGQRGRSHVFVTKDRPGHLRRHGRADAKTPGKTFMGELVVDDQQLLTPDLELKFWAPKPQTATVAEDPDVALEATVLAAVLAVTAKGLESNLRNVRAAAKAGKDKVDDALARLVLAGRLAESRGPNRSRLFSVAEDHSSESAS